MSRLTVGVAPFSLVLEDQSVRQGRITMYADGAVIIAQEDTYDADKINTIVLNKAALSGLDYLRNVYPDAPELKSIGEAPCLRRGASYPAQDTRLGDNPRAALAPWYEALLTALRRIPTFLI